jgi:serine/threonine protein kinase
LRWLAARYVTHHGAPCNQNRFGTENAAKIPASDVYSLGLVFYQLITGRPPRHDVEAVLAGKGPAIDRQLLADELGRSANQGDWAGVAEIIARMCAPERADRYTTVADVMEDLSICEL